MPKTKCLKEKLKNDKWFFVSILCLIGLLVLFFTFRETLRELFEIKLFDFPYISKTVNFFDGILFTVIIIGTIVASWYYGGHIAFMFIAISWNFEILLFMIYTARPELTIELINLIVVVYLYIRESPADQRRRKYQEIIKAKNIELSRINRAYARFVPDEFLKFLNKDNIIDVALGDAIESKITIMFSDIRSFTTLSENFTPEQNFKFLNSYFHLIGPIVRKSNGFIDKYIGDGLMALFPSNPEDALLCAIDMQKKIDLFNEKNSLKHLPNIKIGIGIHTGYAMLGTVGEAERMDSTVIADSVNIASRLEELTKTFGANIIISNNILENIKNISNYAFRYLGKVKVKGRQNLIEIYEVFHNIIHPDTKLKLQTKSIFEQGIKLLEKKDYQKAFNFFKKLIDTNKLDKAVYFYLQKCESVQKLNILPDKWDIVAT